jgi:iron complex outermembrane recepter protein
LEDDFVNTPEYTYNLAAEYGTPITGNYGLTGRVDFIHKSRIEYDYSNSPLVAQSPYGLLNAGLQLDVTNTGLSFAIFGTNLTNSTYAVGGHDDGPAGSLGFVLQQMGAPREWGVSATYKF